MCVCVCVQINNIFIKCTHINCKADGRDEADKRKEVTTQTTQHHHDTGEQNVVSWRRLMNNDLPRLSRGWLVQDDHILYQGITLTGKRYINISSGQMKLNEFGNKC